MKKTYYFLVGTIILLFASAFNGYAEDNSLVRFETEDWCIDVVGCELKTNDQLYVLLTFMNTGDKSQSPDNEVFLVGYQNGIEISKKYSSQGPEGYYAKDTKVQPGYVLPYFEIVEINDHSPVTIELEPYWNWDSKTISYTFSTEEIEGLVSEDKEPFDIETTVFVPGTYSSSAKGIESDVVVTATFDETRLTNLDIDVSGETPGLGADIGDQMTQAFLEAQSPDVDDVSGASITSRALKEAMAEVFERAENGEPAQTENAVIDEGPSTEEAVDENNKYLPGIYSASAPGIESDVKVEATFNETSLTDLKVDVSGETPGLGADIGDQMTQAFLEAQSPDVDSVAGASVTSEALISAMTDVFEQAENGEPAQTENVVMDEGPSTEEPVDENNKYLPGIYSASAPGIESDVKVEATFNETSLTDVKVDVSGETPGLGADIGDQMTQAFLEAQSPDVDGVSGASITSRALKEAMVKVFEEAAGGKPVIGEASIKNYSFYPGAYKATTNGFDSDVTVWAKFNETELVDVDIDVSDETIGSLHEEDFGISFLEEQIPDIDQIAGATITSDAVIKAMECIYEEATNGEYQAPAASTNENIPVYYCREASQENSIYLILDLMEQVGKLEKRVEELENNS